MRCKTFNIPVSSEQALERERKINEFMDANNVKRVFASVANQPEGPLWSVLFFYEGEAPVTQNTAASPSVPIDCERQTPAGPVDSGVSLSREEVKSIMALKKWRADAAAQEGVPVYMVAQNRWLEEIVRIPVRKLEDLKKVGGFGEWRAKKYGPKIVEILNATHAVKGSWSTSSYSAGRA